MKHVRRRIAALALLVCVLSSVALFRLWKRGTPWGEREWSPNGEYYIQRFANWTPAAYFPRPPGDGPSYDGYVRLYTRRGRLLYESYQPHNRYVEAGWSGREAYLLLGLGMVGPWRLPSPAE